MQYLAITVSRKGVGLILLVAEVIPVCECTSVHFEIVIYTHTKTNNDIIWWCNDVDIAINAKCVEPFFFPGIFFHWH